MSSSTFVSHQHLGASSPYATQMFFYTIPATWWCLSVYAVLACILHPVYLSWIVSRAPLHLWSWCLGRLLPLWIRKSVLSFYLRLATSSIFHPFWSLVFHDSSSCSSLSPSVCSGLRHFRSSRSKLRLMRESVN